MNNGLNAARGRKRTIGTRGRMRGSRRLGVLGGALMATSICAVPFVANAAVLAAGCPDGTYQSWTETYSTPATAVAVPSLPVTYVWVDSSAGRFLFGNGTTMNDSSIDVQGEIGVPATGAGFCKGTATATTTTTTTTTTVPTTSTTTTTTTVPESTTTAPTTTVPQSTTTAPNTSTTVPESTTTAPSSTTIVTTTVPGSSTTSTEPESAPPTTGTQASTTTTTVPVFAALPPGQAGPPSPPLVAGSPGPTPLGTTLPETGQSSLTGVTLGIAALGFGMVLVAISRRSAA